MCSGFVRYNGLRKIPCQEGWGPRRFAWLGCAGRTRAGSFGPVKIRGKRERQEAILGIVKDQRIPHQESLREHLVGQGFDVAQATLSRDLKELRLVKVPGADGTPHYTLPDEWDHVPPLDSILPTLFSSAEVVGNLAVIRTLNGGAQAVASGIDWEEFEGLVGTIAGDDTILLILRDEPAAKAVCRAIEGLAGAS